MQSDNVTKELFDAGANGFLSGNPLQKIAVYSFEAGGPILKDRLWYWGARSIGRTSTSASRTSSTPARSDFCQGLVAAQNQRTLASAITFDNLKDVQGCLNNDKTLINEYPVEVQLHAHDGAQVPVPVHQRRQVPQPPRRQRDHRAEATTRQFGDEP